MEWSHSDSAGTYIALGLGLAGLLLLARRFAAAPSARGLVLTLLRGSALAILVVILLNPVRVSESRRPGRKPGAVLLVDNSRSMGLERPTRRIDEANRLIAEAEARLTPDRRPRIEKYRFGRELSALEESEAPRAEEDETRLVSALERLPSRFGDAPPIGVFVVSDGRATESAPLAAVARGYRRLGVPVHVVPVGDPRVSGDVALQDVIAPRDAPPGTRVPVRVVVRSRGFDGRRAEVRIRSVADPNRAPLATLPVTLADGEQSHELVVESDQAAGALAAEVSDLEGEAISENNRVPFRIAARDPKIRVIYMEGTAGGGQMSAEYHWIRDALIEDPNIECMALEVDNQHNQRPRLHRVDDPSRGYPATREELFGFDVVICSDISRHAFTDEQLAWTVELVGERGGGFVMIGGHTSFGSGDWNQTVWDELIPVDMSGVGAGGREYFDGDFRVVAPPGAESHPIWRILDDPERNRQAIASMPPFHGTNLTDRLKPAATALGIADRPLNQFQAMPVLAGQTFGRGRTFAMATDSTYAWGSDFERSWGEGDNRYFRKFWRNVVHWLAENSSGANRRLRVETDKVVYRPGQAIKVTARAFDEKLEETDRYRIVAQLQKPGPGREPAQPIPGRAATLSPRVDDKLYQGEIVTPPARDLLVDPGSTVQRVALEVVAYDGPRVAARTTLDLQALDDPAEFHDPRPDPASLREVARLTGGQVVRDGAELAALLGRHADAPDRVLVARAPLWDRPIVWALLLGLLTTEWIVRRLRGLA
jgi:uncharacterized membrane protein